MVDYFEVDYIFTIRNSCSICFHHYWLRSKFECWLGFSCKLIYIRCLLIFYSWLYDAFLRIIIPCLLFPLFLLTQLCNVIRVESLHRSKQTCERGSLWGTEWHPWCAWRTKESSVAYISQGILNCLYSICLPFFLSLSYRNHSWFGLSGSKALNEVQRLGSFAVGGLVWFKFLVF